MLSQQSLADQAAPRQEKDTAVHRPETSSTVLRRWSPIGWLRSLAASARGITRRAAAAPPGGLRAGTHLQVNSGEINVARYLDEPICTLPAGEEIRLRSIWVIEAYPPSCLPALKQGLVRLGWDIPNRYGAHGVSPEDIREARIGRGLGFHRMGTRGPPSGINDLLGYRVVELPSGFCRLEVSADHPVPGTTVVVFQFIPNHDASTELTKLFPREDPDIKNDLNAYLNRTGPKLSEMRSRVREVQERQRKACADWVSSRLPGLFTGWGGVPIAEFITLEKEEPLSTLGIYHPPFVQAIGLNQTFYASELWGRKCLRLAWPLHFGARGNLLFCGRTDDLRDEFEQMEDSGSMLDRVSSEVRNLLIQWALYEAIRRSTERLVALRDTVGELASREPAEATRAIGQVQREFLRLVADTVPMGREIREFCADADRYHRDTGEFQLIGLYGLSGSSSEHVFEHVRKHTLADAERMGRISADLREMITTTSSILNSLAQERATEENLQLQGRVFYMTIVFGVLATVLALMEVFG